MTVAVVLLLGALIVYFAREATIEHRKAEFWERAYMDKAENLERLLGGVEEYLGETDSEVVRVWASQN